MKAFAALYAGLDASTATRDKVAALAAYFRAAPAEDAAWALHFLSGERLKRTVGPAVLRELAVRASGYPAWLVEDSYAHVGDLAETITLLTRRCDDAVAADLPLHRWVAELRAVPALEPAQRDARILGWWAALDDGERYVLNKLLTGALRVGVSQRLVLQALAEASGLPADRLSQRLAGTWTPTADAWRRLLAPADVDDARSDQPYPFFLAAPMEDAPASLGPRAEWLAEWKWDGIRAQLIRRSGAVAVWSRGEERLDGRFPEIERAAAALPDGCVLDGEVLAWRDGAPLPFGLLQKRIGRLKPGVKTLADAPVAFLAYDLLEVDGADLRAMALAERRARLSALLAAAGDPFPVSPAVDGDDWPALAAARDSARARGTEGLMLKRLASPYQVGRKRGDWFKWKVDPLTVDAVLVYAQAGHGRRANLYTDYTFAVWQGDALVPVAKAYSGLDDAEIARLDRWIRAHTRERFGPVRSVDPVQVFELAFEGIQASGRHKAGVAVRFPRILRWREDKPAAEADRLETLQALAARIG
ncbi:MAG: ATP-dependent DNA ligase [Xanthomonadaceae bacterium]|jgi:DNA ligase-1|nr:ATP-dependent DNA ligase [Xanthomonadaceae bacterium]